MTGLPTSNTRPHTVGQVAVPLLPDNKPSNTCHVASDNVTYDVAGTAAGNVTCGGLTNNAAAMAKQRGFTLLETMVVVLIVAVMAGISILAIRQAEGRTLQGQAERLQIWLQSLADRSILEQNAYGIRLQENRVQAFVYYQRYWYPARDPAPLALSEAVQLQLADQAEALQDDDNELLPSLVFSQGNMLPANAMTLSDKRSEHQYQLSWDDELGEVLLQTAGEYR